VGVDDRVFAVLRASSNFAVLAVEVPVEASVPDGLPVLGTDGFGWQRNYCRMRLGCGGHG
jgi:hypothetical protein